MTEMTENNVPNLDAMSSEDLMSFWMTYQRGRKYRSLFPNGGPLTKTAARDLACYASNTATAKTLRLQGNIARAVVYEDIAERIYQRLPLFAKW